MSHPLQWHPGFYSVLQIEFEEEKEKLFFESEHNLGKKPMQIDLLVIKAADDTAIQKNIGRIFRKYNIVEYKSPTDYLSLNDFYKVVGYTCFYQSDTRNVLEISPEELTITFVCSHYPKAVICYLKKQYEMTVESAGMGIYYLHGFIFPVQFIVVGRLSKESNFWLSRLRQNLDRVLDIEPLVAAYAGREGDTIYEAAMNLVINANKKQYEEALTMCDALNQLFEERFAREKEELEKRWMQEGLERGLEQGLEQGLEKGLEQGLEKGLEQGLEKGLEQGLEQGLELGIQSLISVCICLGASREYALTSLCGQFKLTETRAEEYLCKYWANQSA